MIQRLLSYLLVTIVVLPAYPAAGDESPSHVLAFMEGQYAGSVSASPPTRPHIDAYADEWRIRPKSGPNLLPPLHHQQPASVDLARSEGGLLLRWRIAGRSTAGAIVGKVGPSTYVLPSSLNGVTLACSPKQFAIEHPQSAAMRLHLDCAPIAARGGSMAAQVSIAWPIDVSTRERASRLSFEASVYDKSSGGDISARSYHGSLVRSFQ